MAPKKKKRASQKAKPAGEQPKNPTRTPAEERAFREGLLRGAYEQIDIVLAFGRSDAEKRAEHVARAALNALATLAEGKGHPEIDRAYEAMRVAAAPRNGVQGEYLRQAATKEGLRFLGKHPEAQAAHILGSHIQILADKLADPNTAEKERQRIARRVRRAQQAIDGQDGSDHAKRAALVNALTVGTDVAAKLPAADKDRPPTGVVVARSWLSLDFAPQLVARVNNATIEAALSAWAKPKKSRSHDWQAINVLAVALGCGADDSETLRKKIVGIVASTKQPIRVSPAG